MISSVGMITFTTYGKCEGLSPTNGDSKKKITGDLMELTCILNHFDGISLSNNLIIWVSWVSWMEMDVEASTFYGNFMGFIPILAGFHWDFRGFNWT